MSRKSKNIESDEIVSDEDRVITEENFDEVNETEKEKKSFWSKIFKKKEKVEETPVETSPKKPFKEKFATFFKLFITFGLTVVLTALVSILVFNAIDKNNAKKKAEEHEAYLKTVYQIGDIDVPSFENLTGKAPSLVNDYKEINNDNPTELITYTYRYDNSADRDANLASYVAKLKTENFVITTTSISKSYNEGKTIVTVEYDTYEVDDQFILELSFTRNL